MAHRKLVETELVLRDFGYDLDLFARDEVDEKACGPYRRRTHLPHDAQRPFLPQSRRVCTAGDWEELATLETDSEQENDDDLQPHTD